MRVIAAGTRFFPYAHPGDKTFWLHVFRTLAERGDEIHVINIDRRPKPIERVGSNLTIETLPAIPFYLRAGAQATRYNPESIDIGAITNYGSKTLTLPRLMSLIERRARELRADVIHLVDNLGPAVGPFVARLRTPAFASAITYDPRYLYYDGFLRASFAGFRGVGATSETFRDRLIQIGLSPERVSVVRWGADPIRHAPRDDRRKAKEKLGVSPDSPLVFWAGYIQQITEADFHVAYRAVLAAQRVFPEIEAWFCFKPAHYRSGHASLERPRVHLRGDAESFEQARAAADVFLSPVTRKGSILAPPLTWVESMLAGLPILTTPCGGAEETLNGGRAGTVVPEERLADRLVELLRDPATLQALRSGARGWGVEQYSLQRSADSLRSMWARHTSG